MSFMFEVYYGAPVDLERENRISSILATFGGQLTYWEGPSGGPSMAICLTYEFETLDAAETAAERLREIGEHVEGPYDY